MKRIIPVIVFALVIMLAGTTALAASPLGKDDFEIKLGKTSINLLTNDTDSMLKATGKKLQKKITYPENVYTEEYWLIAKEATLYFDPYTYYPYGASLTKKGVTARGIKIGSKESALLAAYPEPYYVEIEGKYAYYSFRIPNTPEHLTESDEANLDKVRPEYYYEIFITINNKTNKVTGILYMTNFFD